MAAMATGVLTWARSGDEVLASASLYGGTFRLLRELLPTLGISSRFVPPADLVDAKRLEKWTSEKTRLLLVESPTNPSLEVLDLEACCAIAKRAGLFVLVDNTFATPILQRPLALGADLVAHSLTKALAGHSDIIGGALVGTREVVGRAREVMKVLGGCMDPHAAFLALRGLRTLHLRVARQCENAQALARAIEGHEKLARVLYPGLSAHPGHDIAARQMSGFGGMVSLVLRGGVPAAERFYDALRIVTRAASLGGVESLASLPVHTSHVGFTDEQLRSAGVDPGTVRLSIGVEDAADIVADVRAALAAV
jgi:cystathionine beta-lyase/cystathionine gamma-synthase